MTCLPIHHWSSFVYSTTNKTNISEYYQAHKSSFLFVDNKRRIKKQKSDKIFYYAELVGQMKV